VDAPQLRPLGVGDIVDRVFALYRARPMLLIAASAVPYLVFVLAIAVVTVALAGSIGGIADVVSAVAAGEVPTAPLLQNTIFALFGLLFFVVIAAVVILSVQTTALVHATSARYLGKDMALGEAFRLGLRSAPRVILAGLAIFLMFIGLWLALTVLMVVSRQGLVVAGIVLLGFIGTVYLFASTLVTPVVATLENLGPISAIRRAWSLSTGNRWRILGLQLLLVVINAVLSAIVSTIFVTSLISDAAVRTAFQQITNAVVTILWAPVEWGTFAILYYDLRVRREAFDLQLAAEALPRGS